jgi:hypothetical protein
MFLIKKLILIRVLDLLFLIIKKTHLSLRMMRLLGVLFYLTIASDWNLIDLLKMKGGELSLNLMLHKVNLGKIFVLGEIQNQKVIKERIKIRIAGNIFNNSYFFKTMNPFLVIKRNIINMKTNKYLSKFLH